jgi:hypothetical protein
VNEDLSPGTSTLRRDGQRKLHASALDCAKSLDRPHPPRHPPVQLIMSLALRRREAHSFFHSTSIPRPSRCVDRTMGSYIAKPSLARLWLPNLRLNVGRHCRLHVVTCARLTPLATIPPASILSQVRYHSTDEARQKRKMTRRPLPNIC